MNKKPASADQPEYFIRPDNEMTRNALLEEKFSIDDQVVVKDKQGLEHRVFPTSLDYIHELDAYFTAKDWLRFTVFLREKPKEEALEIPRSSWRQHSSVKNKPIKVTRLLDMIGTAK